MRAKRKAPRFILLDANLTDYEWYSNQLLLACPTRGQPGGRLTLQQRDFTIKSSLTILLAQADVDPPTRLYHLEQGLLRMVKQQILQDTLTAILTTAAAG